MFIQLLQEIHQETFLNANRLRSAGNTIENQKVKGCVSEPATVEIGA